MIAENQLAKSQQGKSILHAIAAKVSHQAAPSFVVRLDLVPNVVMGAALIIGFAVCVKEDEKGEKDKGGGLGGHAAFEICLGIQQRSTVCIRRPST